VHNFTVLNRENSFTVLAESDKGATIIQFGEMNIIASQFEVNL